MSEKLTAVTVPKWGIEMQEGTLTQWLVDAGEPVQRAQALAEFETDKIVNELEAPAAGVLLKRLAEVDATLAVGTLIGVIGAADTPVGEIEAFIANFKPADTSFERAETPAASVATTPEATPAADSNSSPSQTNAPVNPVVRRLAEQLGVDLTKVHGSGERGRITKEDVQAAAQGNAGAGASPAPNNSYDVVPLSATRKHIADHLSAAKPGVPHFYLERDISVDALLAYCAQPDTPSFNAAFMYLVSLSLQQHPELNGRFEQGELRRYRDVNIATAVAAERGLVTPVIKGAQSMGIADFTTALRHQIDKAKQGKLSAEDVSEATFTVSNLGMMGIDRFSAIINPPQLAILAVGGTRSVLARRDGDIVDTQQLSVTLSCDHRIIDGAVGAQFLITLARRIEAADFAPTSA